MEKIDLERLICHILQCNDTGDGESANVETADLLNALHSQGLYWRDGKLKEVKCPFKDGDVLADKNHPESVCIFRKATYDDGNDFMAAYCGTGVGTGRFCTSDDEDEVWGNLDEMVLATDSQREMLFAEMKENGYGFDFRLNKLLRVPKPEAINAYEFTNDADAIFEWLSCRYKLLGKCSVNDGETDNVVCTVRFKKTVSGDIFVVEIPRMLSENVPLRIDDPKSSVAEFIRKRNLFVIKPSK